MSQVSRIIWCVSVFGLAFAAGCTEPGAPAAKTTSVADNNGLGATISSLSEVFASNAVPVKGYALVGGLNGTGSSECPPEIRSYLEKYVLQHLSGAKVSIDELISSPDTAVVVVEGIIPPAASKNQRFDVRCSALPGTQTTSLKDGWLYGADLYESRYFGAGIKTLATAEGPVFIDSIARPASGGIDLPDMRTGNVLGGGVVLDEFKINLALRKPDYRVANQIRNRINEKFGSSTAWALAAGSIELHVPDKYTDQKDRFLQLVGATYLFDSPDLTQKRILFHIQKLAGSPDKKANEITLEAIGIDALPKLAGLLNSSDPQVRLHAARCMLNLGDKRGKELLWGIVSDKTSAYRLDAIEAIGSLPVKSGFSQDAILLLRGLLRDDEIGIRIAAYEKLVGRKDASVESRLIADSFYLDLIMQPGKPAIFVSRRNQPRVAIFGAPVYFRSNVFIQTPEGDITINVPEGDKFASIIRRHPRRPDTIIQLKSSLELADIIQTLCREPASPPEGVAPGLGVSYSTLVTLLKQMADSGAVDAEFIAGPPPKWSPANSP